jgi:hypothetical protein
MSPEGAVFEVPPTLIAINHDDYHAKHVGRTAGGWQFFLTTPFVPAKAEVAGAEFVALYLFHAAGQLMEAVIDNFGPRATLDNDARRQVYERRLRELGRLPSNGSR